MHAPSACDWQMRCLIFLSEVDFLCDYHPHDWCSEVTAFLLSSFSSVPLLLFGFSSLKYTFSAFYLLQLMFMDMWLVCLVFDAVFLISLHICGRGVRLDGIWHARNPCVCSDLAAAGRQAMCWALNNKLAFPVWAVHVIKHPRVSFRSRDGQRAVKRHFSA